MPARKRRAICSATCLAAVSACASESRAIISPWFAAKVVRPLILSSGLMGCPPKPRGGPSPTGKAPSSLVAAARPPGRAATAPPSGCELAQHVRKDAAVAEVFQLVEGVDPAGQRHLP